MVGEVLTGRAAAGIQGELADYNTLVEIMNMDSEKRVVDEQTETMHEKNEKDRSKVDSLYLTRKQKEDEGTQAEKDIQKVNSETFFYRYSHFIRNSYFSVRVPVC